MFVDLIDPGDVSIRSDNDLFILSIGGGDAAESYAVDIYFYTKVVFRRIIYSSLNPDKPYQDTYYFGYVLKDE